ncbi:MAG: hypothetical protein ACK41O_05600 [Runella zeae]
MQSETQVKPKVKRNMDRFMAMTGKSEKEYYEFATEVGRKMHINSLDKLICAKLNVYTVAHLVYVSTELPFGISENEVDEFLIEHSQNPYELGKLWLNAQAEVDSWICKESIVANSLTCFPKGDFEKWGDPNHLPDVSKSWFNKEGIHLDTQAMEMSENSGFEIEVQDLIDFVMKWRPRTYKSPALLRKKRIEARWKEVTTFSLKDYYVSHLIRMCQFEKPENDLPF